MVPFRFLLLLAVLLVGGCVNSSGAVYSTAGRQAMTTGDVNLRAGPGTNFPRVVVVPAGSVVALYGCIEGRGWCDVGYSGTRGWISSRYLDTFYDSRRVYVPYQPRYAVPIVTFDFGYWDNWYSGYPWYGYRYRYPYYRYPYRFREFRRNDDVIIYPRGGGRGGRND